MSSTRDSTGTTSSSVLARARFSALAVETAAVTRKEGREYPVFLVTGRKVAGASLP